MNLSAHPLIVQYAGMPALLDANILLLYWCASFDPGLIHTFKRLNSFEVEDIEMLAETLKVFSVVRTTPYVLTEVSNLANSLPKWKKQDWSNFFANKIEAIEGKWLPAKEIAGSSLFHLGLTDSALSILAKTHVIVTIDWPLSNSLEYLGLNVLNFTRIRSLWLE